MNKRINRGIEKTMKTVFALTALLTVAVHAQPLAPAQLEEKIRGLMDENRTVGMAVVLVKGDKAVYQKAFGYRDKDTREPLDINDVFRIASISKSFSGMSVMQLVEAGKLSLDDDVNDILGINIRNPRYPDVPVTIKMLLSHTSSMKDGGGYRDLTYVDESKTDIKTIREKAWLPYPPGKGYKYCNRALNIIGLVIEKVSGERFDEYVLNHILKPIGADNAGFNLDTLDKSTFAQLYTYDRKHDRLVPGGGYARINESKVADGTYKIGVDGCYWSPTGGMKISAPNLVKWMMTLRSGGVAPNGTRIVSEAGCKKLLSPVTPGDPGTQYCLTTRIETRFIDGKALIGHTGSAHGLFSCMYFCPDEDWGFVCICSSAKPDKVNGMRKCYYQVINLLYDQYLKPREKPLKVLMIGNSFSISCLGYLPEVAEASGRRLDLASLYIGGCSLERHSRNIETAVTNVNFRPYRFDRVIEGRRVVEKGKANIPDALALDKWDVVTIQQASHFSWDEASYHPWGDTLVAKIRELAPQAKILVQETWSYPPWDKRLKKFGFDQVEMYTRLHNAYHTFAGKYGFGVIPVGTAAERCPDRNSLFTKPDFHFNRGEGEYLQALVWTAKLFGTDVRTCTYRPPKLDAARADVLKSVAMDAVRE